jgi:hypothetical protein
MKFCLRTPCLVGIVRPAQREVRESGADLPRQEIDMRESRFELSVGDSVRLDDQILTVIDINGEEITFRVDFVEDVAPGNVLCAEETAKRLPPR